MYGFEFVSAQDVTDVCNLLDEDGKAVSIIAGGTDLLGEIKQGILRPERLASIQGVEGLRGFRIYDEGVLIGAMTTLADIASDAELRKTYSALAEACDSVATPQIRNVGTIGGNLCQRPRCWYYRNPHFDCRKKSGDTCFAIEGVNKFHAIFDVGVCPAVHPSDMAVALVALDARVLLISSGSARMLPVEDFLVGPDVDVTAENILHSSEILAEVVIPSPNQGNRNVFLKAKERQAMDFALASVALSADVKGDVVTNVRVVLGGVAPTPRRALDAEEALVGKRIGDIDSQQITRLAVKGATPLSDNEYKVRLTSGLVLRALRTLLPKDGRQGEAW